MHASRVAHAQPGRECARGWQCCAGAAISWWMAMSRARTKVDRALLAQRLLGILLRGHGTRGPTR